jgi:septum formation protein
LASQSPRRAELLEQIQVRFQAVEIGVDEAVEAGEPPKDYVLRLAVAKARAGWRAGGGMTPALGADTAVVDEAGILGKPEDDAAAARMLRRLSGKWHEVYCAVAVCSDEVWQDCVVSRVRFRRLTAAEIATYVTTGEPRDKAGAYAIQGLGGMFVERLEGSYSGVVGLPICETAAVLARAGVRHGLVRE